MTTLSPQTLEAQNNLAIATVYLSVPLSVRNKWSTHSRSLVLVALQWVGQEMVEVSDSYACDCYVMIVVLLL